MFNLDKTGSETIKELCIWGYMSVHNVLLFSSTMFVTHLCLEHGVN